MNIYAKINPIIRLFLPRICLEIYKFFFQKGNLFGVYKNWEEANLVSSGYENHLILQRVENALLQVKQGNAVYERDSVLFYERDFNLRLLAAIGIAKSTHENLSVLDFGGSLGSTYYQHKDLLNNMKWNIVEQEHFVKKGKELFEIDELRFFYSIDECMKNTKCNFLILSSVIQYLEKPLELIEKLMKYKFLWILIDRTPFFEKEQKKSLISIQKVPEQIYSASLPIHIFNMNEFKNYFESYYEIMFISDCNEKFLLENNKVDLKCLFLKYNAL